MSGSWMNDEIRALADGSAQNAPIVVGTVTGPDADIRDRNRRDLADIQANESLTNEGREQAIKALHKRDSDALLDANRDERAARAAGADQARRDLFGRPTSKESSRGAFKLAGDCRSADDARRLYDQAVDTGDSDMIEALVHTAIGRGWSGITRRFAETATAKELAALEVLTASDGADPNFQLTRSARYAPSFLATRGAVR